MKIAKKIAASVQALVLMFGFGAFSMAVATPALSGTALAGTNCTDVGTDPLANGAGCSKPDGAKENLFGTGGVFQLVANTLIFLVGALAVLFLIIGGLRYVVSNGDPKSVEGAKNTITYAIIGIVVAILAFAAVQFVIQSLNKA
jgi:hypothetical protein